MNNRMKELEALKEELRQGRKITAEQSFEREPEQLKTGVGSRGFRFQSRRGCAPYRANEAAIAANVGGTAELFVPF